MPELMISPMLDLIFLLLAFFIISTMYMTEVRTISIALPDAQSAETVSKSSSLVTIKKDGSCWLDDKKMSLDVIVAEVKKRSGSRMNDRQRYAVGIAAAVLIHLFAAVMLGLFGVKYMEVPFRGEVLQVSLDAGGGNRGGGGSKGRKAPAAKSSEAKINDVAEPVEMPDEEINEKAAEEKPEPQDRADKKETADTAGMSASDAAAGNEGMNTQGDGSGSGGETGDGDGAGTGDGSGTGTGEGDGNGSGPGAGVPITPPTVINKVLPVYPPSAKMKETTGITYVTILVNASGTVDSAYVAQGSGSSVLDAAAIDAAYQWTFSPALDKYGVPVPCRITFPVEFRLN